MTIRGRRGGPTPRTRPRWRRTPPVLALLLAASPPPAHAAAQHGDEHAGLGDVDFGVSCAAPVRDDFDRAVALLHHMTYPVAFATFERIADAEPSCAMAYWGMAMSLFQPVWPTRPSAADLDRGWELVRRARAAGPSDRRETMFIDAAAAFFDPRGAPDYWARIERWADATAKLRGAFPADVEARAFFALSRLAVAGRGEDPAAEHARAAEVLDGILREHPTHPGAVHYTIHANDFDGRQDASLEVVRSYGAIAPENPHALHMPTHIFVRLGAWDEVIAWNERAADAALAQRVGPAGEYVWDEYPHAIEYLVYAHLQRADDRAAEAAIDALRAVPDLQPSFKTAFHLASTAARYALERRDWRLAAGTQPRSPESVDRDDFPWPEAVAWLARGIGSVRTGDPDAAAEAARQLGRLEERAADEGEAYFATQIRILALELEAWRAQAGDPDRAVTLMTRAAKLEERTPKHPVTPAPTVPAREMLGDLYAELGRHEAAIAAYAACDERFPGRFRTILGLARSLAATGDAPGAAQQYRRLIDLAVGGSPRDEIGEAKAYVAGPARDR